MTMGGKNFMKFNCLLIFLSFMRSIKPNCMYVRYFVTKIVLTYCENNCSSDREKRLTLESEGQEFAKNFEITITIYSNSARSEQFLVTQCFLTCS